MPAFGVARCFHRLGGALGEVCSVCGGSGPEIRTLRRVFHLAPETASSVETESGEHNEVVLSASPLNRVQCFHSIAEWIEVCPTCGYKGELYQVGKDGPLFHLASADSPHQPKPEAERDAPAKTARETPAITFLLDQLPEPGSVWPHAKRDEWLRLMGCALDESYESEQRLSP